jgi:hypothetical protein
MMRRCDIALAALLISGSILGVTVPAGAQTYPVCLAGGDADSPRCDYANLEQCRAAASGIGYCISSLGYTSSGYPSSRAAARRVR